MSLQITWSYPQITWPRSKCETTDWVIGQQCIVGATMGDFYKQAIFFNFEIYSFNLLVWRIFAVWCWRAASRDRNRRHFDRGSKWSGKKSIAVSFRGNKRAVIYQCAYWVRNRILACLLISVSAIWKCVFFYGNEKMCFGDWALNKNWKCRKKTCLGSE